MVVGSIPTRVTMEGGFFYIIQSQKNEHGRYYIGSCIEVTKRVKDHNRGNTNSTRGRGPWVLVYSESYPTLAEARARERQVKKWKSRIIIEKLILKNQ